MRSKIVACFGGSSLRHLSPLNDQEVVPLVDAFYAGLAKKLPAMDALREAKLQALRNGAPARTWAAFMAIGDPLVVVPLKQPPKSWWAVRFK